MNIIVLDLEWNQTAPGTKPHRLLPFEIIEIGAVRLSEDLEILDTFHSLIKPNVYHEMQEHIYQMTHVPIDLLKKGKPFAAAASAFLTWCGGDYRFCTWAKQDLEVLQINLRFYHMLGKLPGPILYLDGQKLFSLCFEDGIVRRSLQAAYESLALPEDQDFHRAIADALYTARVIQKIDPEYLTGYESLDIYQHPGFGAPSYHLKSKGRERLLTGEKRSLTALRRDAELFSIHCPVCEKGDLRDRSGRRADWFSPGLNSYQCSALCPAHGDIQGKIKIKTGDAGRPYAFQSLQLTTPEAGRRLCEKRKRFESGQDLSPAVRKGRP